MKPTENYLKMCEKAKKLQEEWVPEYLDQYACRNTLGAIIHYYPKFTKFNSDTWLPRQEDIQKIFQRETGLDLYHTIEAFLTWWLEQPKDYRPLEEYWLTFLYEVIYHKRWNGEDWETNP